MHLFLSTFSKLSEREKWLLLARMLPLVENNFNLCELGPRSTGKSHIYKEISPNSILVSGGHTTVANLFYNMGRKTVGLVGLWDCVAFDEVAGIKFKDKDGIQIMKDYMASNNHIDLRSLAYMARNLNTDAQETITVLLGANETWLDLAFHKIKKEYGSTDKYLSKGLHLTEKERDTLKDIILN